MKTETKKAIKILSEKYYHDVFFEKDILKISNSQNTISIQNIQKDFFEITYNTENENDRILLNEYEIFDVLINIFRRYKYEKIKRSPNELITLDILNKYEQNYTTLEKILSEIITTNIEHKELGGNRILQEYYKGYLILTDDFANNLKSNVIKIKL